MKPDYDKIAWCYDFLCYVVFGNTVKKAQTDLLSLMPADSKVLIAGGGTGWILEKISAVHLSGLKITYADSSTKMIEKSKKRNIRLNKVEFINKLIGDIDLKREKYDVIITPFFFDNFSAEKCRVIFQQLNLSLKENGLWLFTDFKLSSNGRYWQKYLLKLMYSFFRLMCHLEARQLPETEKYFISSGYKKVDEKMYYKHFIVSTAFKKPGAGVLVPSTE